MSCDVSQISYVEKKSADNIGEVLRPTTYNLITPRLGLVKQEKSVPVEEILDEMDNEELPAAMSVRHAMLANNLAAKVSQNDQKLSVPEQKSSFINPDSAFVTAGFGSFTNNMSENKSGSILVRENRDCKYEKIEEVRETASF